MGSFGGEGGSFLLLDDLRKIRVMDNSKMRERRAMGIKRFS